MAGSRVRIELVGEDGLVELLPLMRGYCDFYEVAPPDDALLAMSRALMADPQREGVQLMRATAPAARSASPPCSGRGRRREPRASE